jgi:hypothetical protein
VSPVELDERSAREREADRRALTRRLAPRAALGVVLIVGAAFVSGEGVSPKMFVLLAVYLAAVGAYVVLTRRWRRS